MANDSSAGERLDENPNVSPSGKDHVQPQAGEGKPAPERTASVATKANGDVRPWWKSFEFWTKATGIVVGIITALASLVGTSYFAEKVKLTAQIEALKAKHEADSDDRKDKNAAAERDLRTKYVDLALERELGIDHRARIFGYLSSVMVDEQQRAWAVAEAKKANEQREVWLAVRKELDGARRNHTNALLQYAKAVRQQDSVAAAILRARYENEAEHIKNLNIRIADLEGRSADVQPEIAPVITPTKKSVRTGTSPP